jgi:hypothetical protein
MVQTGIENGEPVLRIVASKGRAVVVVDVLVSRSWDNLGLGGKICGGFNLCAVDVCTACEIVDEWRVDV